jgi:hypothetical protein
MAAGKTYDLIATTTLSVGALSYTFSSIPGTYTDLVLISNYSITGSEYLEAQFNGDSAGNYGFQNLTSTGYRVNSVATRLPLNFGAYPSSGNLGLAITNINDYANTTTHKNTISESTNGSSTTIDVGQWRNTGAITSIKIMNSGVGNINAGSTFNLYGIGAA